MIKSKTLKNKYLIDNYYKKYTVALTGGICSGKSTISNAFANFNVYIIDSDIIAREVVQPGTKALKIIKNRYGKTILNSDGYLLRNRLRNIVFRFKEEKIWLNNLLHPLIHQRAIQLKNNVSSKYNYILWVIPLLVENKIYNGSNRILVVDVEESKQLERIQTRYKISINQAKIILDIQSSRFKRLNIADDIINNNGEIKNIWKQVKILNIKYLNYSKI